MKLEEIHVVYTAQIEQLHKAVDGRRRVALAHQKRLKVFLNTLLTEVADNIGRGFTTTAV